MRLPQAGIFVLAMTLGAAGAARGIPAPAAAPDRKPVLGVEALCRLDLLPSLKPSASVGCVSSYDRS
jgi:hypothetical protein